MPLLSHTYTLTENRLLLWTLHYFWLSAKKYVCDRGTHLRVPVNRKHLQEPKTPAHCSLLQLRFQTCSQVDVLFTLPLAAHPTSCFVVFAEHPLPLPPFPPSPSYLLLYVYFSLSYVTAYQRWEKWQWRGGGGDWEQPDRGRRRRTAQAWQWVGSWWEWCLSPPENICWSKTVSWLTLSMISRAQDVRNRTVVNTFHPIWTKKYAKCVIFFTFRCWNTT